MLRVARNSGVDIFVLGGLIIRKGEIFEREPSNDASFAFHAKDAEGWKMVWWDA